MVLLSATVTILLVLPLALTTASPFPTTKAVVLVVFFRHGVLVNSPLPETMDQLLKTVPDVSSLAFKTIVCPSPTVVVRLSPALDQVEPPSELTFRLVST